MRRRYLAWLRAADHPHQIHRAPVGPVSFCRRRGILLMSCEGALRCTWGRRIRASYAVARPKLVSRNPALTQPSFLHCSRCIRVSAS